MKLTPEELRKSKHDWNSFKSYDQVRTLRLKSIIANTMPEHSFDFDQADKPFQFDARAYLSRYGTIGT